MRPGEKRVVVDWDGTVVEDAEWPKMGDWSPDAINALRRLLRAYEVVVFSTSLAPREPDEKTPRDPSKRLAKIREMLDDEGLHAVKIWTNPWKPGAAAYIDNKAVRYEGDWYEVLKKL